MWYIFISENIDFNMKIWIYFLLDFVLLDFVSSTPSTHLYTKVDGNLIDNYRIYLTIDIQDSTGLLLYAIDKDLNQFTIKRKIVSYRKSELIYNFNGHEYKEIEINNSSCQIIKYKILIQLIDGNLVIGNENTIILRKIFTKLHSEPLPDFPVPEEVLNFKKSTHFWIGNISPHIGFQKYPPLKHQLIGCVTGFYIHSKPKILQYWSSGGDEISETCWHTYKENQCNQIKCEINEIKVYNLDCRLSVMNVKKFCYRNLFPYDEKINSFEKLKGESEFTAVKLIWKQNYSENYCLIEIALSNKSSILFYTNINYEIFYCIKTKSTNCTSVMLEKSSFNSINHLIITFENHNINLKISNGIFYKAYNDAIFEFIEIINVGYSQFSNDICLQYQGDMIFLYNSFQFKPIIKDSRKMDEKKKDFNIPIWILLIFIGVIILQTLFFVSCCCCRTKKNPKQQSNEIYNFYEEGNIQERNLPDAPRNNETETEIYSAIEKYEI